VRRIEPRALAIILLLCVFVPGGCSSQTEQYGEASGGNITVRVVSTQELGQSLMFDDTIQVPPGTSAMDALKMVAEVETAFGGGFIDAIDGIRSRYTGGGGEKGDWFICANGILSNTGALDYTVHGFDTLHCDFHGWSFRTFIPAIIGDFPEPFLHGYEGEVRPTVIVYENGFEDLAVEMGSVLYGLGVADVSISSAGDLEESIGQNSNLVIIGTPDCDLISELNKAWDRLGFFVRFEEGDMAVYSADGEVGQRYGAGCGVLQATQNPWNPKGIGVCENVAWMVSGTDSAGVESAARVLIDRHDEFKYAFAAVTANGEVMKVPR